jgi:alpha-glucosidase
MQSPDGVYKRAARRHLSVTALTDSLDVRVGWVGLGIVFCLSAGCAERTPQAASSRAVIQSTPTRVAGVTVEPHGVTLRTAAGTFSVTAVNDYIFRVRASRDGVFAKDFSWAVVPGANAPTGTLKVSDEGPAVLAFTPEVHVRIKKDPLGIVFLDASDQVISEDAQPTSLTTEGFRVNKAMPEDEHYYGLGDKGGTLDRRGRAFTNWNVDAYGWQESTDPLYKSIPFFVGLRKGRAYGIFLDNTWRTWFDFGKSARDGYSFGSDGGELDYYFIAGPHPKSVLQRYAELTGKTPVPPLWALGFQQCRYSYYPEARVYEVAQTFRKKKIPGDVIYLDIDYQKNDRPFTVDRDRFPRFEQMIADLGREGFRVIAITDPHIAKLPDAGYRPYDEGVAGNHFVHNPDGSVYVGAVWPGDSVFPDFTWAPARAWWGTLYRDFVNAGIAGFWNDMNEPTIFRTPTKTMPLDVVHRIDSGGTASHREVHNVFGMQNSRATYEGLLGLQRNRRPFVLTRASYAGGQRFAASWTGDNSSTWNHYRISVPTLLSLGLSGYPMVGDDIGGFRGSPPPDLLTRWFEIGAFNPIFRDHTNKGTLDQEPWVHGPQHEAIRRRYIETRYRLMPYVYTLAEEASRTGVPLMRPLWLEHPETEIHAADVEDRVFLFGPDLLIEPKLDEMLEPLDVVVPPGVWYDYWTGERWLGTSKQKVRVGLGDLFVLVRGGAIVPHQPLVQSTGEVPKGPLELRVYLGPDCRGSLYMDDGVTFNYQSGVFLRLAASCQDNDDSATVTTAAVEGSFEPWFGSIAFVIHGLRSGPKQVAVDGKPVHDFSYDGAKKIVTIVVPYAKSGQAVTLTY